MSSARRSAAEVKIDRALEHLQQAQNHLDWAVQELASLSHGAATMNRCYRLRTNVNEFWHALNTKNDKMLLDHEPDELELEKLNALPARAHVAAKVCALEAQRSALNKMAIQVQPADTPESVAEKAKAAKRAMDAFRGGS